jgi:peroxiredoxin
LREQLQTYRLQTEPWTFVIDRNGIISSRFEGAFSSSELERAVAKAQGAS